MSNTPQSELRSTPRPVEKRAGGRSVGGYAAVYSKPSRQMGAMLEVIEPRAFSKSAGDSFANVVATLEHSPRDLLGTVSAGTLAISLDNVGMEYTVALPETQAGNDCLALVARGDLRHSSFEFRCWEDDFTYNGGGPPVRHLNSVQVISVSPVSNPAYLDSSVGLRSYEAGLRSFARFADADPDDVIRDAVAGVELRRYLERTDVSVPAPVTVPPTPLAVAQRGFEPNTDGDLEISAGDLTFTGARWIRS
jgi:HK97 family phage prohead protease